MERVTEDVADEMSLCGTFGGFDFGIVRQYHVGIVRNGTTHRTDGLLRANRRGHVSAERNCQLSSIARRSTGVPCLERTEMAVCRTPFAFVRATIGVQFGNLDRCPRVYVHF